MDSHYSQLDDSWQLNASCPVTLFCNASYFNASASFNASYFNASACFNASYFNMSASSNASYFNASAAFNESYSSASTSFVVRLVYGCLIVFSWGVRLHVICFSVSTYDQYILGVLNKVMYVCIVLGSNGHNAGALLFFFFFFYCI